jgi:hypothetical protein
MENNTSSREDQKIAKRAYRAFVFLASLIYVIALGFYYPGGHFFEWLWWAQ